MKRSLILLSLALAPLSLTACAEDGDYQGGYAGGGLAYDGYYDGFYGPVYDGYWGGDGYFYYRHGEGENRYVRGDRDHFRHGGDNPGQNFQPMHGNFTPRQGMYTPHFHGAR